MSKSKEAIAFVLDASASMSLPFPSSSRSDSSNGSSSSSSTRFQCAKAAIEEMIASLIMLPHGETIVVIVNAGRTRHHLCCDDNVASVPFRNVMEINGDGMSMRAGLHNDDYTTSSSSSSSSSSTRSCNGMRRPTITLLKELRAFQIHQHDNDIANFCDGIIVAADAIHQKTRNKIFSKRQIMVFADACTKINLDSDNDTTGGGFIPMVIDGLQRLHCSLVVIGFDFKMHHYSSDSADNTTKETAETNDNDYKEQQQSITTTSKNSLDDEQDSSDDEDGSDEVTTTPMQIQSENEKFLYSMTQLTPNGYIIAVTTLQQVNDIITKMIKYYQCLGNIPTSTRRKMIFNIAPTLSVDARFSLLISQANIPSLKREAVLLLFDDEKEDEHKDDEELEIKEEEMLDNKFNNNEQQAQQQQQHELPATTTTKMSKLLSTTSYWDANNPNIEIPSSKRTQAYKYGSDLIPIGSFDLEGLKTRAHVSMTILGYTSQNNIPRCLFIGSPYAVTGEDYATSSSTSPSSSSSLLEKSKRSCIAISALAQALQKLHQAAICTFVKSKDADPLIGALYPLLIDNDEDGLSNYNKNNNHIDTSSGRMQFHPHEQQHQQHHHREKETQAPHNLFFIQLPFANDVNTLAIPPLNITDVLKDEKKMLVADELVDSLMLPTNVLDSETIANPSLQFLRKTLFAKAMDPTLQNFVSKPVERQAQSHDEGGVVVGKTRAFDNDDVIYTPTDVLEKSQQYIVRFKNEFPIVAKEMEGETNQTAGKRPKFWSDARS